MPPKLNLQLGSSPAPGFGSLDGEDEVFDLNDSVRITNQGALQVR
jgi:hypothetical protein